MINSVDIIIPCYNVENTIRKCIESILVQKCESNIFIYLVNDGSIDNTQNILREFDSYSNINLINHKKNMGLASARNTGIKAGNSEIIFFLDSDMTVKSDWIYQFTKGFVNNNIIGIVGDQKLPFELDEKLLDKYLYSNYRGARQFGENDNIHFRYFLFSNTCIRRSILDEVGLFDESFRNYGGEDTDLALRIWKNYPTGFRFSNKAVSFHWSQKTLAQFYENMKIYGNYNFKYLIKKHPDYISDFGGDLVNSFKGKILFNKFIYYIISCLKRISTHPMLIRYFIIYWTIYGARIKK